MTTNMFTDARVLARRNIEHIRQVPEKLTNVTVQPLMFVLLFAYVFGGAIAVKGGTYQEYLLGGILIQTLAFASMNPAQTVATDFQSGSIDRFRSLPIPRSAYLLGHFLAEMLGSLLTIAILLGTGLIVGWRTHASVLEVTEAMLLLLAFSAAVVWLGLWLGIVVRSPDAVMGIGFVVVFPLTFVSNAFVPISSMPTVLQWIASVNPISVLIAAVRELFGNPVTPVTHHIWPLDHPVAAAWLYTAILLVGGYLLAQRRYRARTTE